MANERVRGFLQLAATNVVSKVCWALTLVLLLRCLGQEAFGLLATLWSMATIASGFVDLGTTQALVREGARAPGHARYLATQSLRLQCVLITVTGFVIGVAALQIIESPLDDSARRLVVFLGIYTPLVDRLQYLFTAYSQLGANYAPFARTRSLYFVVLLVVLGFTLLMHGGVVATSVVFFIVTMTFVLLMGFGTWRHMPAAALSSQTTLGSLIRHGLPFLGMTVLTLAYGRIEVAIFGAWGLTAAAGAYHMVYQLILVVYSVCGIYFTIMYPRLYRHLDDNAAMSADFRDSVRWLSVLACFATPPLMLFPEQILHVIGGDRLAGYASLLRILAMLILLTPLSAALNFLLPINRANTRVVCDAIGIALTLGAGLLGAVLRDPRVAAIGAVVGYAAAIALAHGILAGRLPGITSTAFRELIWAAAPAVPSALVAAWMPVPWWFACIAFAILYAALLVAIAHPIKVALRRWFIQVTS